MGGLITQDQLKQVMTLDDTIRETSRQVVEAQRTGNEMVKALAMAHGMNAIRDGLTPLMPSVMRLMGTPLGFRTDKDHRPVNERYSAEQVRDVLIVGLMRGLRLVGNEINIIGGNCYATKEAMRRLCLEVPGVTQLRLQTGVPILRDEWAYISAVARWTLNGQPGELVCSVRQVDGKEVDYRIIVKANSGMGMDALIGKAESKLYRKVYAILTGIEVDTTDDLDGASEVTATHAGTTTAEGCADLLARAITEIASAATALDATALRDSYLGPDSTIEWTPEEGAEIDAALAKRTDELAKPKKQKAMV